MKRFWAYFWLTCMLGLLPTATAATQTEALLLLSHSSAKPGEQVMAAVQLKMGPGWHTYWRTPGDSGMPTKIEWTLPGGVTAGEIQWPIPAKEELSGLISYAYSGTIHLLVPLTVGNGVPVGDAEIKAKVSWLECKESCLPGKAQVQAKLTIGSTSEASPDAGAITAAREKLPKRGATVDAKASWDGPGTAEERPLVISWAKSGAFESADFFPYAAEDYEVVSKTDLLTDDPTRVKLRKVVKKSEGAWPTSLAGLLVQQSKAGVEAFEATIAIEGPKAAAAKTATAAAAGTGAGESVPPPSLAWMFCLAFLGGLILNIMPCVLPVIALKILGFVGQSRDEPRKVRELGFIYGLGVIASFVVLAGLVIGVKSAGGAASWGMQFQNPKFLLVMTMLVALVAMNLFGLFEVTLGGAAMGAAGDLASKEGRAGAFFNGVLATALATPCTAPFLGVALGFALAQSSLIIVLMFVTVGLGLAAPYVVLCVQPAWLKYLPKPGVWMEKFKVGMGFPMLATAVWLFTLTTRHFGTGSNLWLGIFLVLLAFGVWIWGEFVQRGRKRKTLGMVFALIPLLAGYFYILEGQLNWRSPVKPQTGGTTVLGHPGGIEWQPWSREAVAKARDTGAPVLVDFTADWCLTCQANKKTSLEIESVRKKLKEIKAVALLGDYTTEDPAITAELQRYKRAGVPLVLVFPANPNAEPIVLPELLTPSTVLNALDEVAKANSPKK